MRAPLPDPEWSQAAAVCPACGYSLAGITPPIPCPECGVLYSGRQFVVCGVPAARSIMSWPRLAAAGVLGAIGMFGPQIAVVMWIGISGWVSLAFMGGCIAAGIALVVTAPRSQGGKSRFIFVPSGVNVIPMSIDPARPMEAGAGFIRFRGDEGATFKRVSPVWGRLRIGRPGEGVVFSAGVRCPEEAEPRFMQTVRSMIQPASSGEGLS